MNAFTQENEENIYFYLYNNVGDSTTVTRFIFVGFLM